MMLFTTALIASYMAVASALNIAADDVHLTLVDIDGGKHAVTVPRSQENTEYFHVGKNVKEVRGVSAEDWPGQCIIYCHGGTSAVGVGKIGPFVGGESVVPIPQDIAQDVFGCTASPELPDSRRSLATQGPSSIHSLPASCYTQGQLVMCGYRAEKYQYNSEDPIAVKHD